MEIRLTTGIAAAIEYSAGGSIESENSLAVDSRAPFIFTPKNIFHLIEFAVLGKKAFALFIVLPCGFSDSLH